MSLTTIAIDTGAAWVGTVSIIQNGHPLSYEASWGPLGVELGARLGWLKNAVDAKPGLADVNAWTGANEFQANVTITAAGDLVVNGSSELNGSVGITGALTLSGKTYVEGGIALAIHDLPDANAVIPNTAFHCRVPAAAGARTYTLPSTSGLTNGHTINIERVDTGGAIITIQDPTGPTTMGTITANQIGWIEVIKRGSSWRVSRWGGTVASIHATP